ncbi:hypothetical protein AX16_010653 [Volvariella volvacea WC 439]|nr:hypothetical protein AX16_010653 [Volvariella volvacea WC 439]
MQQQPIEFQHKTDDLSLTAGKPITPFSIASPAPTAMGAQWNSNFPSFRPLQMSTFSPVALTQHQPQQPQQLNPVVQATQVSWDEEFNIQELAEAPARLDEPVTDTKSETEAKYIPHDGDELARTAAMLLENVKHETNPKFKNSQFMGLMKQLRDGLVVVEGNQMVENTSGVHISKAKVDIKGKGKAIDSPFISPNTTRFGSAPQVNTIGPSSSATLNAGVAPVSESRTAPNVDASEKEIDAYLRQENENYMEYWETFNEATAAHMAQASSTAKQEWGRLQDDWDQFEATATGIRPVINYQFQEGNPYLLGDSSRTRHHLMHSGPHSALFENVLELEAEVQRDMNNARAWYDLGVKQQENEREQKALHALQRSVELDPTHLPSWLALAISHTNDTNRVGTYKAIREWVDRNEKYKNVVLGFNQLNAPSENAAMGENFNNLIQCLITIARSDSSGGIDADVQIALAVLLNTNEDYEKAQDCFRTALAVRPDDWLLYNRVGATMANSGHAEEALQYYYRALELNPAYIRARFNLGISCINLRRYEEAAQHILDALVLQDSDGIKDSTGLNDKRGVTSAALWDSLKTTCLHLQRVDLATLCDRQDLETFRLNFQLA